MGKAASVLLVLAVLGACGGTSHTPGGERRDGGVDAGEPTSPEARFLRDYHRALCERAVSCAHPAWDPSWHVGAPAEICHPELFELSRRPGSLSPDAFVLDPEAARACLESLEPPYPCAGYEPPFSLSSVACGDALGGPRAEGEPCGREFTDRCQPGLYCHLPTGESTGVCRPRLPLGASCPSHGSCERSPWEGAGCLGGVCREVRYAGEPCVVSLQCYGASMCIDGVCADAYEGMPCEPSGCGLYLHCVDGACEPGPSEGEPCGGTGPCELGTRCWGERGEPRVCVSDDGRDVGDLCDVINPEAVDGDTCTAGLVCRPEHVEGFEIVGRCVPAQPDGEPCSDTLLCSRGSRCVDGTCVGLVPPGVACGPEALCPLTHTCTGGRCEPLPTPGDPCDPSVGCVQGLCVDGACCLSFPTETCDAEPPFGICAPPCRDPYYTCSPMGDCDAACGDDACWRVPTRCAPVCPSP